MTENSRSETQRLLEAGQPVAAAARLESQLRMTPNDSLLNARLAHVLLRLRRYDEAHTHALRAIELAPESVPGHVQLAYALLHTGRFAEAAAAALQAQQLQPDSAEADYVLLVALEGQGKWVEAEFWARRIVERRPNNPQAHKDLARLLLRQDRLTEAQQVLRTAFALRREYVTGWPLLVIFLRRYHLLWLLFLAAGIAEAAPSWYTAPLLLVAVIFIAGAALNEIILRRARRGLALLLAAALVIALFVYGLTGASHALTGTGTGLWTVTSRPTLTGTMTELINQQCHVENRLGCLVVVGAKRQAPEAVGTQTPGSQRSDEASTLWLIDTVLVNQSDLELMVDCFVEDPAGQLYERLWDTGAGQDVLATARLVPGDVWRDTIRFALPADREVTNLRCQVYQRTAAGSDRGIGSAMGYKHYDRGEDLLAELPTSAR